MNKTILLTGVLFGLIAIILGAFGAHTLKNMLDSSSLESFETGVRYQMYHALFFLVIGSRYKEFNFSLRPIYYLILFGTICFSFSIYVLSTKAITGWDIGSFGLITPFGGVLLILGWALLGYRIFK